MARYAEQIRNELTQQPKLINNDKPFIDRTVQILQYMQNATLKYSMYEYRPVYIVYTVLHAIIACYNGNNQELFRTSKWT